ncbi:MAG: lysophospholipid acyltransferase family protein [bacterium]|nr:lysophospholipid acyltransferase family protein [bacterium]
MKPTPTDLPQAPELGWASRVLGSLHVTGVFWYRLHRFGVRILPNWGLAVFTTLFTSFFFVALIRIRKAIASNLEAVLGPCGFWQRQVRIYRTMWSFAWCLSERYERMDSDERVTATMEGEEHWHRAEGSDEGLILVTAHIGHWEAGSMLVPAHHVHVVREEELDPRAQELMRELFAEQTASAPEGAGITVYFARADPMLGLRLLKALRRGEMVAVQGDRPPSSERTATIEMFGRPVDFPAGPAALARAAGVAMLPVFVLREGRHRSRLVFRPEVRVTGEGDEGLAEAMARIAADVEWAIRREPHQWFCFRALWPD